MKILLRLYLIGFAVVSATAADIETNRAEETGKKYEQFETLAGRVYQDVQITRISDAGISITHADGAARLRFEDLSPEQRKQFGITKEDAAAIYAREMKAAAAYEAKVEEQQKAKRELLAKQNEARLEAARLAALTAQIPKKVTASNIQSTVEIPSFPTINGANNRVLYGSPYQSRTRITNYDGGGYYGGYVYPSSYGYYPSHYSNHYPSRTDCKPTQRSMFHFTIR
jgi:hypothetical protein